MTYSGRGRNLERNVRRHYSKRSDVLEVFRDTYGKTDVCVVFKDKIYLIECKSRGYVNPKEREELIELAKKTPDNVKVFIYYLEDPKKSAGWTNKTKTQIKQEKPEKSMQRHQEKVKDR